jgi:AraC-like DNA-binding protein
VKLPLTPEIPRMSSELPVWPPVLAVHGPGARSERHAHHAMHVVIATTAELRVRAGSAKRWTRAPGLVTAPDVAHEIDGTGGEVLLVFVDPESDVGAALRPTITAAYRVLTATERDAIDATRSPLEIMTAGGVAWAAALVSALGGAPTSTRRTLHPRVRRLLGILRELPVDGDASLEALARAVGLSPGRLMHAFTDSIGIPLRPYLAWLRLQRAAVAVTSGAALSDAAHAAGFADAAHMTRTFRRMFGTPPSALAPRRT